MNCQSMENQLNQLKENYSIGWREFKIQDLFEKIPTNKLPYKAKDLKGIHNKVYNLPALTAGVLNQGLAYYVPREGATILKNVISVSANGANTGVMYYQPREFTVLQDSYAIKYSHRELNSKHYTYIVSALQKAIRGHYDWSNKAGWERIKTKLVKLPIDTSGEISFDYMEGFINIIETDRLLLIKSYLQSIGFEDIKLNKVEKEALENIGTRRGISTNYNDFSINVEWRDIELDELFNISGTKSLDAGKMMFKEKGINFIGRTGENNGLQGKIDLQKFAPNESNTITATVIGNYKYVRYQREPYYVSQNINKLSPKFKLDEHTAMYFITEIQKFVSLYDGNQGGYRLEDLKKYKIRVPMHNDLINLEFMENLISGIQKIVVKKMIKWNNKRIEAAKKYVKNYLE